MYKTEVEKMETHVLWSRDSVLGIATGWTIQGSHPRGDEIFRTCPYRPWGPPILLYNGYRVFHGGKAPGSWH